MSVPWVLLVVVVVMLEPIVIAKALIRHVRTVPPVDMRVIQRQQCATSVRWVCISPKRDRCPVLLVPLELIRV